MLSNKIPRLLLFTALVFSTLLFGSIECFAIEVTCQNSGCTLNPDNTPLFSESNILPLWSTTKTVTAHSLYSEARKFAVLVTNPIFFDILPNPLEKEINITIKEGESGAILWGPKTLADFKNAGEIQLSNIPSGEYRNYLFNAELGDVDNSYQGKEVTFDLVVGFETLPVPDSKDGGGSDENDDKDSGEDGQSLVSAVAGLATQLGFGGPPQTLEEVAGTIAPETLEPEAVLPGDDSIGKVKGTSVCVDPKFWWLLFIVQFLLCYIFYKRVNKQNYDKKKQHYSIEVVINLVFMFIFWKYFCPWWDVLVSGLIGVFWILLLRRKITKLTNSNDSRMR